MIYPSQTVFFVDTYWTTRPQSTGELKRGPILQRHRQRPHNYMGVGIECVGVFGRNIIHRQRHLCDSSHPAPNIM